MKSLLPILLFIPGLALAQVPGFATLTSARGIGMGGAFRALGMGADATLGNPASLETNQAYQFELTGGWDPGLKEGLGGLTIRDSTQQGVAAGIDYHYLSLHDAAGNRQSAHLGTLAVAFPLSQSVLLGVSGKYLYVPSDLSKVSAATLDAGFLVQPTPGLFVGLSGHNLLDTHHAELARFYSAQVGYTAGMFSAEFDVSGDPGSDLGFNPLYNVGAEYVAGQAYPLELGFAADTLTGAKYVSGGVGFFGQGGGLDLAYRHQTNGDGRLLMLTLRLSM
jgi:hypothetical protein